MYNSDNMVNQMAELILLFCHNGIEVFRCSPVEFRRVHTLNLAAEQWQQSLVYSHSDLVVTMANGQNVMIEIIQGLLKNSSYVMKIQPKDLSFDVVIEQDSTQCVNWVKKLVFMSCPDLTVKDMYCGKTIATESCIFT